MPAKNRITSPLSEPVRRPMRRNIQEAITPLPIPVTEGPVEPPKAPPSWWVYVVIGIFVISTLMIVGYVLFANPFEAQAPTIEPAAENTSGETSAASGEPSPPPVYSYTSVVTPVVQADHYAAGEDVCLTPMPNLLAPESAASTHLIVALEVPTDFPLVSELGRIQRFVDLAEDHHVHLTIGLAPAKEAAEDSEVAKALAEWGKAGHEISLYFDAVSVFPETDLDALSYGNWLTTMHGFKDRLEDACGCTVTSWTGADTYARILDVAKELGLVSHAGWIDRETGNIPEELDVVNPWSPGGNGSLAAYTTFDPFGSVVAIPSGVYPATCQGGDRAEYRAEDLSFTTQALYESLKAADATKVNVFRFSVVPTAVGMPGDDDDSFEIWDAWFTSVVDPLVKKKMLVSSTTAEVASQYTLWLDQNIGKIELK